MVFCSPHPAALSLILLSLLCPATAACDNCTVNPALPSHVVESFTSIPSYFNATRHVAFTATGGNLGIFRRHNNPMVQSLGYLWHGRVQADIMGAVGTGVILLFYLQSDDLDEIDIVETFGGNVFTCQTNFFVKGNISNHARGEYHMPPLSPLTQYHTYAVEWTADHIVWTIDGTEVRRTLSSNPHGFPLLPMRVIASLWAGGDADNERGTIDWAGGPTNYDLVPYIMRIRNVRIDNYLGGDLAHYTVGRDGTVGRTDVARAPHPNGTRAAPGAVPGAANASALLSYTLRGFFQVRSRAAAEQRLVHWAAALLGALHWYM